MKDNELRGLILQKFYDLRHSKNEVNFQDLLSLKLADQRATGNICDQLEEHGLIYWEPHKDMSGTVAGLGKISANGVDVIEETATSPISIVFNTSNDHRVSVHASTNSNVQVGNNNSQTIALNVDSLNSTIEKSTASTSEKNEAKSIITKIADSKLLQTVLGVVVTTAAKSFGS